MRTGNCNHRQLLKMQEKELLVSSFICNSPYTNCMWTIIIVLNCCNQAQSSRNSTSIQNFSPEIMKLTYTANSLLGMLLILHFLLVYIIVKLSNCFYNDCVVIFDLLLLKHLCHLTLFLFSF